MANDVRTILAQHAQTISLLGVDFLPLGKPPADLEQSESLIDQDQTPPIERVQESSKTPSRDFAPTKSQSRVSDQQNDQQNDQPGDQPSIARSPISFESVRGSWSTIEDSSSQLEALKKAYIDNAMDPGSGVVFGEGDPNADLMFIGDTPGEDDLKAGRPFVGRDGQLLEKMINAMGFSRETVYLTQLHKESSNTTIDSSCSSLFLYEQIRIVQPRVIVSLGLPVSQLLLKTQQPIRALRGTWHELGKNESIDDGITHPIEVIPTYHPGYLLRSYTTQNRQAVWSDLQSVMSKLG